jgi:pantothenate kinase-related protein Tda10
MSFTTTTFEIDYPTFSSSNSRLDHVTGNLRFGQFLEVNVENLFSETPIVFTPEQELALKSIDEWLDRSAPCFTLTGPAGTGKSTLMRAVVDRYGADVGVVLTAMGWLYTAMTRAKELSTMIVG